MEHRLMKQLNPTFAKKVLNGPLTSYPAIDFINPGIGNVVQPYGLFVPLHTHDTYKITKSKPPEAEEVLKKLEQQRDTSKDQEGAGEEVPISLEKDKKEQPS